MTTGFNFTHKKLTSTSRKFLLRCFGSWCFSAQAFVSAHHEHYTHIYSFELRLYLFTVHKSSFEFWDTFLYHLPRPCAKKFNWLVNTIFRKYVVCNCIMSGENYHKSKKIKAAYYDPCLHLLLGGDLCTAVVIMRAAKEEVRRSSSIQSLGRRSG